MRRYRSSTTLAARSPSATARARRSRRALTRCLRRTRAASTWSSFPASCRRSAACPPSSRTPGSSASSRAARSGSSSAARSSSGGRRAGSCRRRRASGCGRCCGPRGATTSHTTTSSRCCRWGVALGGVGVCVCLRVCGRVWGCWQAAASGAAAAGAALRAWAARGRAPRNRAQPSTRSHTPHHTRSRCPPPGGAAVPPRPRVPGRHARVPGALRRDGDLPHLLHGQPRRGRAHDVPRAAAQRPAGRAVCAREGGGHQPRHAVGVRGAAGAEHAFLCLPARARASASLCQVERGRRSQSSGAGTRRRRPVLHSSTRTYKAPFSPRAPRRAPNPPLQTPSEPPRYFSYEHFYVIYCKFWELDADHDFSLERSDLARYSNCCLTYQVRAARLCGRLGWGRRRGPLLPVSALEWPVAGGKGRPQLSARWPPFLRRPTRAPSSPLQIVDRIFEEAPRRFSSGVPGRMGYEDFVWFILSEEDKTSDTAIEYWCAPGCGRKTRGDGRRGAAGAGRGPLGCVRACGSGARGPRAAPGAWPGATPGASGLISCALLRPQVPLR